MVTLQDIDVALARAEQVAHRIATIDADDELFTCLSNARGMLQDLGREASASLERMNDTLESLSDISQGR
jgi:hypothetical protein